MARTVASLVCTRTAGERRPDGVASIRALHEQRLHGDRDPGRRRFTTTKLAKVRAMVFLNTTGDVLNPRQQAAFESHVTAGGGTSVCTARPSPSRIGRCTRTPSAQRSPLRLSGNALSVRI
jgi:hypothetical protein